MARRVTPIGRIIPAVGKHVVTQEALPSGDEGICVDESTDLGIVITRLEVVETRILGSTLAMRAKTADFNGNLNTIFINNEIALQ